MSYLTVYCSQNCAYDLDEATLLTAIWTADDQDLNCEDVGRYDGDYQCVVEATTAGEVSYTTKGGVTIETNYTAIWNAETNVVTAEFCQLNVNISCPVCAKPEPTYQWYDIRGDIIDGATQSYYTIPNVTEFGNYTCEVTNFAMKRFLVGLVESGPAGNPTDFQVLPNVTSSSITVSFIPGSAGNNPPVTSYVDVKLASEHQKCDTPDGSYTKNAQYNHTDNYEPRVYLILEGLEELSVYDLQLYAVNSREENSRSSEVFQCNVTTAAMPEIYDVKYDFYKSSIIITWQYAENFHQNEESIHSGLMFSYKIQESEEFDYHPEFGTIELQEELTVINNIDPAQKYVITTLLLEGNNTLPITLHENVLKAADDSSSSSATGLLAGLFSMSILIILALVAIFLVLLKKEIIIFKTGGSSGSNEKHRSPSETVYKNQEFTSDLNESTNGQCSANNSNSQIMELQHNNPEAVYLDIHQNEESTSDSINRSTENILNYEDITVNETSTESEPTKNWYEKLQRENKEYENLPNVTEVNNKIYQDLKQ